MLVLASEGGKHVSAQPRSLSHLMRFVPEASVQAAIWHTRPSGQLSPP